MIAKVKPNRFKQLQGVETVEIRWEFNVTVSWKEYIMVETNLWNFLKSRFEFETPIETS